ncbi:MAG: VanW family protein [Anaerolineales bacterium]|nr:VanW family protein [Anaerolineales bacterium]
MRNISTATPPISRPIDLIPQIAAAIIGGVIIFSLLMVAVLIGYNISFADKIYPGVVVAGVDVSGTEPAEASLLLETGLDFPKQGKILFRDGEKIWLASPSQVGFYLNPQASAAMAYQYGRTGGPLNRLSDQFKSWYLGTALPPMYVFDENTAQMYIAGIAAQTDSQKVEASLSIEGVEVVVQPSQTGRQLDIPATLESLQLQLETMQDGEIRLKIEEDTPVILNVEEQAQIAELILSQPLILTVPDPLEDDPGSWTFESDFLAQLITIEQVNEPAGERYQVGLETDGLTSFLEGIAPQLAVDHQNARMMFNDETRQLEVIQPAVIGRSLNVADSVEVINDRLLTGEHEIALNLESIEPEVGDDATADQLGISELVSSHTSYFYGSSAARIQNITTAAGQYHGILIPPGATFSLGEALGDVSLDNGYAEALIIYGDRTIEGVGGGVCQVSTTLFRTVFFGGYPVVERTPHAYRVGYYELKADGGYNTSMAGLDATVYTPFVDFKFTNDTPNWLLMETYVNQAARSLTWKFYSTSDGRSVDWHTTGLKNKVDPPDPLYEENPELAKGNIVQVDWAVEGADVTINRTVIRNGETLFEDAFTTHYMPWQAIYEYGPGTKNMPPKEGKKQDKDG